MFDYEEFINTYIKMWGLLGIECTSIKSYIRVPRVLRSGGPNLGEGGARVGSSPAGYPWGPENEQPTSYHLQKP